MRPKLRQSKDIAASLQSPDRTLFFLVIPEKFGGSLATYKVVAERHYQEKFREYVQLTETEAELDGRHGIGMTFQGKPANNNTPLKFRIYSLPYDARMVRLSFLTLDPLFTDAVPIFEKIAVSYHSVGVRDSSKK